MNKLLLTIKTVLSTCAVMGIIGSAFAQQPAKTEVLAGMTLANNYFMQKWPDPGASVTVKGITRTSNLWTRAVYYEGLMAMYKIDAKKSTMIMRLIGARNTNGAPAGLLIPVMQIINAAGKPILIFT